MRNGRHGIYPFPKVIRFSRVCHLLQFLIGEKIKIFLKLNVLMMSSQFHGIPDFFPSLARHIAVCIYKTFLLPTSENPSAIISHENCVQRSKTHSKQKSSPRKSWLGDIHMLSPFTEDDRREITS